MYPFRGVPRLVLVGMFMLLTLILLLASPFSGHAGKQSRRLISQVVEKVQKGEIGPLRMGSVATEEEEAMRQWEFRRALQYEGTGARIQAFLDKARSGQPIVVSVIGGSVSKGRGLVDPPKVGVEGRSDDDGPLVPVVDEPEDDTENLDPNPPLPDPLGLGATTLYSPENLHVLIYDWLNSKFPNSGNRLVNGAQGGVGAGYFSWCFKEHIDEDSDLVLVELGINDLIEVEVLGSYEHLIRGVLELPNKPAIINIETFTTLFPTLLSSSSLHLDVAAFYDIPSLSIRDVLLPRLLGDPDTQMPRWFRTGSTVLIGDSKVREWGGVPVDLMHISALGHALAAGLVIQYLTDQLEKSKPAGTFAALGRFAPGSIRKDADALRITDLPPAALTMPFDPHTGLIRHDPTCRSMNSGRLHTLTDDESDDTYSGLIPGKGTKGWSTWAWKEKRYLVAKEPGSLLSFPFIVSPISESKYAEEEELEDLSRGGTPEEELDPPKRIGFEPLPLAMRPDQPYNKHPIGIKIDHVGRKRQYPIDEDEREGGRVLIGYQRSATLGLGSVWCWVDDDKASGRRVEGWWEIAERNMGMVDEVASGIGEGAHTLHCELLEHTLDPTGGTEFRIFAIMHD